MYNGTNKQTNKKLPKNYGPRLNNQQIETKSNFDKKQTEKSWPFFKFKKKNLTIRSRAVPLDPLGSVSLSNFKYDFWAQVK
jgi:hypothetical protein